MNSASIALILLVLLPSLALAHPPCFFGNYTNDFGEMPASCRHYQRKSCCVIVNSFDLEPIRFGESCIAVSPLCQEMLNLLYCGYLCSPVQANYLAGECIQNQPSGGCLFRICKVLADRIYASCASEDVPSFTSDLSDSFCTSTVREQFADAEEFFRRGPFKDLFVVSTLPGETCFNSGFISTPIYALLLLMIACLAALRRV